MNGIVHRGEDLFPYEFMNPQDNAELAIYLVVGHPHTIKLKYIWDDESGTNNEFDQVLTL